MLNSRVIQLLDTMGFYSIKHDTAFTLTLAGGADRKIFWFD